MQEMMGRLKPDPIPRIHPVPEYLADASLTAVYEDTKATLQVPWMGVVTMAFAHYPAFYETLWDGLRELCASAEFVAACGALRAHAEESAIPLAPAPLRDELVSLGYADREIDEIRDLIEVFSHGNMPYLMIATAARLLLEEFDVGREGRTDAFQGRHGPRTAARLTLIEAHHADAPTVAVYADIRASLGLPFVNTDYRALARWPSYFALAWGDLRGRLDRQEYASAVQSVHAFAVASWQRLAVPRRLTPESLRAAAQRDAALDEVTDVVRLFQWLLPGLVTNVAFFRAQLEPH